MSSYERQIRRGEMLFSNGRLDDALKVFASVLQADPSNVHALNDAALVFAEMGEADRAVTLFERALAAEPTAETAFYNLLDLFRQRQDAGRVTLAFRRYAGAIPESDLKAAYRNAIAPLLAELQSADEAPAAGEPAASEVLHVVELPSSGGALLADLAAACLPEGAGRIARSTLGADAAMWLEERLGRGLRIAVVVRDPVHTLAAWNADPSRPEARVCEADDPGYPGITWAADERYARQAQLWNAFAASVWAWRDRLHIVTYEALVREPDVTATDLAAWLGVPAPPAVPVVEDEADTRIPDLDAIRAAVERYAPLRKVFGYAPAPRLLDRAASGDGRADERVLPEIASGTGLR